MPELEGLWPNVLLQTQEEISTFASSCKPSADPSPNRYVEIYRSQELFYWTYIPRWMAEDWRNKRPERVLDIGCAYGTLLLYAHRLTVCQAFGIDFIPAYAIPALFAKWNLNFAICNIELDELPWPGTFDSIILTECLEHFNFNPLPTLRKIRELLSKDGVLYLSTPDGTYCGRITKYYQSLADLPDPVRGRTPIDDHVWQYSQAEVDDLLRRAGFQITRCDWAPGAFKQHINLTAMAE